MSSVINDPKELRRFQTALRQFNSETTTNTRRIEAALRSLSQAWRDGEYQKFAQDLEAAIQGFERYLQSSDSYISHLDRKATPLEQYLGSR